MTARATAAERVSAALRTVLSVAALPVRLRVWDGSVAGPQGAPTVVVHSRRALRRLVWAPGELGLARAYVAGEMDVEGDLATVFAALSSAGRLAPGAEPPGPSLRERLDLLRTAARLGVIGPNPPPPEEVRLSGSGRQHSQTRDAAAVTHHYDISNEFYRLVLGPSMVYSCAVWEDETVGLDAAQEAKLDLICRKLGLREGSRLLDVGCGWGSLAIHAVRHYGAEVVGITLSGQQAALARKRIAEAGLTERIDIRIQDYRDVVDGPFDAISSVGMAENAGETTWEEDRFIARYVFPDGELISLGDMVGILESTGLEVIDVDPLRRHYAMTLRAWVENLEQNWDAAVAATSVGRARVWRLYMTASALAFDGGTLGVNQVLLQRPGGDPPPLRRREWV